MAKTKIMISDEMNFNIFNNNTLFNWKNDDENEFSNKYEKDICNFTPFVGEETFTDDKNEKDFFKNCPNEIDSNLDADSSKNLSDEDKKESEELNLLPSNLFDSIKINPKDNNKEILDENISIVNKLNINSKPFIPKEKKFNGKNISLEKNINNINRCFNSDHNKLNKKNKKNKKIKRKNFVKKMVTGLAIYVKILIINLEINVINVVYLKRNPKISLLKLQKNYSRCLICL